MYVIMVYDVGVERVVKVLKTGRKYLTHVQNSLLEGELSPAQYKRLKFEVSRIIDDTHDTVMFYTLRSEEFLHKERLGIATKEPGEFL
ncbi:MAG: CRISPR-associated endonuclease Cas2 [Truepera sp.]|nr:CRISPR-associated endonuclease Cas2 [Truepera sp.]